MSELYQSLSHSKWDCKYHVVFVPKYRRKVMFGEIRKFLGPIFHELARQKECRIIEGHLMPDHVHRCIEIPPKHSVASVIGLIKGKSAIAIARQFGGKQRNFAGEHFWARGYAVSTVGFELEAVKRPVRTPALGAVTLIKPPASLGVSDSQLSTLNSQFSTPDSQLLTLPSPPVIKNNSLGILKQRQEFFM